MRHDNVLWFFPLSLLPNFQLALLDFYKGLPKQLIYKYTLNFDWPNHLENRIVSY